ncbi:MAG: TatD family hydrolase, partial [Crenarchaeota archaeon]|nr:TatD family hydrolase [Thermoproteota archaeon]
MFIDSHAHLQWDSFDADREQVLENAKQANVECMITIGFDFPSCLKGIKLAQDWPQIYATIGIHPNSANEFSQTTLNDLRKLASQPKVVAIGEIGLDYFRDLSSKETQIRVFESQLKLAQDLSLPVVIHDRDAHRDILEVLTRYKGTIKGIIHCFSADLEFAQRCIDLDFFISFAGNLTYKKAYPLHIAA